MTLLFGNHKIKMYGNKEVTEYQDLLILGEAIPENLSGYIMEEFILTLLPGYCRHPLRLAERVKIVICKQKNVGNE